MWNKWALNDPTEMVAFSTARALANSVPKQSILIRQRRTATSYGTSGPNDACHIWFAVVEQARVSKCSSITSTADIFITVLFVVRTSYFKHEHIRSSSHYLYLHLKHLNSFVLFLVTQFLKKFYCKIQLRLLRFWNFLPSMDKTAHSIGISVDF